MLYARFVDTAGRLGDFAKARWKRCCGGSGDSVTSESTSPLLRLLLLAEMQRPKACKFLAVPAGVSGALAGDSVSSL